MAGDLATKSADPDRTLPNKELAGLDLHYMP